MARVFGDFEKKRFVDLLARGRAPALAAEDIGFTYATIRRHLKEDVAFTEAAEQAILVVDARVEEVAYDMATSGDNPASTWKWLERRRPAQWGETKNVQVTGPGGGPIQLAAVTTDALREVLTAGDTRDAALAMVQELPAVIEATGREAG